MITTTLVAGLITAGLESAREVVGLVVGVGLLVAGVYWLRGGTVPPAVTGLFMVVGALVPAAVGVGFALMCFHWGQGVVIGYSVLVLPAPYWGWLSIVAGVGASASLLAAAARRRR